MEPTMIARGCGPEVTPAETMKVRAMPTCTTGRGGVIGPQAPDKAGGDTRRGGTVGPLAHGNTPTHVVCWHLGGFTGDAY